MKFGDVWRFGEFYRSILETDTKEIETTLAGEIDNPVCKAVLDVIDQHIESKLQASLNAELDLAETKWYLGATEALLELSQSLQELTKKR